MDVGKVAAPNGMVNDGRREALKRFARYAAAAPPQWSCFSPARVTLAPKRQPKRRPKSNQKGEKKRPALLISGTSRALSE